MRPSLTSKVDRALRLQFCSGLANTWFIAGFAWAALNAGLGPWGWAACLLVPFGVLEMAVALYARDSDRKLALSRWLALFEFGSLAFGGCVSFVVGSFVLVTVKDASPPRVSPGGKGPARPDRAP